MEELDPGHGKPGLQLRDCEGVIWEEKVRKRQEKRKERGKHTERHYRIEQNRMKDLRRMEEGKDALLEELERSTLQDSDEYSSLSPPPLEQQHNKESELSKAAEISAQGDLKVQLVYTTNIKEPNIYSEVQEPKGSMPPPKTSAAAQLDELMAHLNAMQAKVSMKPDASEEHPPDKQDHTASLDSMLGGLEQELQELGIATVPKGHCASCQKPIVGKVIHALGHSWHPEHFVCTHCKEEIGSSPFFERTGSAYCAKDYHHLFSPRCAYCAAPITDKVLTAMGQTWHPEHFFCSHCGEVFGAEGFHEKDNKPYCRKDFLAMFSPKCGGCNRPVLENYLSAMNNVWHPECFVCGDCFSTFSTGSFFELDGRPFCELHYHCRRGTLCHGCGQPITGRCISAMGHKFHPEHFVCAFCLKQLSKGIFREQNDKAYCQLCYNKLFSL